MPKDKKLPWWKRGLKVLGGVVGQVASGVVGIASALGALASLIGAFAAFPVSLALLGYTALYAGCAYGCKKVFERAGRMRNEGLTGEMQADSSGMSSSGNSGGTSNTQSNQAQSNQAQSNQAQSQEGENRKEQDGILQSGFKMAAGTVGAVVSVAGALVGKAFEGIYNRLFPDKKTNAISSMCMGALGKSLDLAKDGWSRGRIPITAEQVKELRSAGLDQNEKAVKEIENQNLLSNNLKELFLKKNTKSSETEKVESDPKNESIKNALQHKVQLQTVPLGTQQKKSGKGGANTI